MTTIRRGVMMAGLAGAIGLVCSAVLPTGASALPAQPLARQLAQPDVVHVVGNQLENAQGDVVQLMGVNRSGSEYACSQGWGIFDGPVDDASIQAIASWNTDIVRVPLNEDCWLGINGVNPQFGGAAYRKAIKGFAHRLEANGLLVDFDLHWNAPGAQLASGQQVMADEDHSPAFWRSMANTFKSDPAVLFELYNEPHDISWSCWLHGCTTSDGWQTAGMQQLVNTVRHTGATNVILVGGLGWSSDLSQWLKHEPNDPAGQLAATFHTYDFSGCNTQACWDSTVAKVAERVPVVATEFGETDCGGGYVTPFMNWADGQGVSYLGWTWDTWDCDSGPALITNYDGTPTGFGQAVQQHYLSR